MFSALLPLGNYKFKINQPFGASGVKVTLLLETAVGCGLNPAGTRFFLQTRVFVLFRAIVRLFIFAGLVQVARLFLKVQLSAKFL